MTQIKSTYNLRLSKQANYTEKDCIDDYKQLGTFLIDNNSFKIEQHSDYGLLIDKQASFSYFHTGDGMECCCVKFYH